MTTAQHYKTNLHLAIPVMIGQLGHMMVSVADSIMVGQLGTVQLAAVALANSIYAIFMLFGIGLSYGLTPLVAYADGKNRSHLQGMFLRNSLWLNTGASIVLFVLVAAVVPALQHLGQDEQVVIIASPYMYIVGSSIIPLMVFLTFKQFAEGLSQTRVAMAVSIICNLVNVGLNYLLIYGKWGMPEMGVNGAAVATLISRILMVVLMVWYIRNHKRFTTHIKGLFKVQFNRVAIRKLLQVGIPSGLQYIFEVSAFSIAAVIAGTLGANALASHQIAINIASVSYMAATGLGSAATIRIGNQSGRGDVRNLRMAARSLFIMTAAWMGLAGLIILLFKNTLAGFYSKDEMVLALAGKMLIVVVIFQLSDGLQAVGLGALRGFTDVRVPTLITFFAYWIIALPAAWLLAQYSPYGAMGIWYALAGGLTISAILLLSRFQMQVNKFALRMGAV